MSTEHPKHSAQHHASKFTSKQRTIALIIVALAFVMDLLDTTIVNIAIPAIQDNLGASYATIQWLIAGYSLTFATLLITGGRMGDVFGYKKLFLIGVSGFSLASLLCGIAWNPEVLIAARLIQGMTAALMVPQVMSLMQVMYKPSERAGVMGLFGALAGVAASLGPVIGGFLIHANIAGLDWRPIFLINVPVGVFAFFMAMKYLPNGKSAHPLHLDILGTGLITIAMLLLVFPLIQGRELDWPVWTFIMMAAAIPVLALFIWWQRRKDAKDGAALIPPALFKVSSFVKGLILNIVFQGAMTAFFLPFTLLLQVGLGYEVILAAVTGIPTAIGIASSIGFFGQKLIPKLGRYALTVGSVVMLAGLVTTYLIVNANGIHTAGWHLIPGLLITGSGMGLVMAPIFALTLSDVDTKHAGSASGVLNAIQQLGAAIGVALIGVVFFGQLTANSNASFTNVESDIRTHLTDAGIPAQMQSPIVEGVKTCYNDRAAQKDSNETPESCKKFEDNGQPQTEQSKKLASIIEDGVKEANANNFIHAFGAGIIYQTVLIGITFILSFMLPRHLRPEAMQQGH
ncbi:MAG TPA: MFS transporter [Candidatus Saccharimonadales bacterium]|nr:MFS transporter [Candidatus Saccharimonadales bacterium]